MKRTKKVQVRYTDNEFKPIEAYAEKNQLSLAEAVRVLSLIQLGVF